MGNDEEISDILTVDATIYENPSQICTLTRRL